MEKGNMTNIEEVRKTYKIDDNQYKQILNVMEKVYSTIESKGVYSKGEFERRILNIVRTPEIEYKCDWHMVKEIAQAFLEDNMYIDVFLELYKNDISEKTFIDSWYEENYGDKEK